MNTKQTSTDCLIIGAGLAGLLAGRQLAAAGVQSILVEKASEIGGRLATTAVTTETGTAVVDEGAQYFTVREAIFQEEVNGWLGEGIAQQWSKGFVTPDGSSYPDGHPRYCGSRGMASIAQQLAAALDVRLKSEVASITHEGHWLVTLAGGQRLAASALLLTPPLPQSLALLAAAAIPLPDDEARVLARVDYDPCLALTVVLGRPSLIPNPGGIWPGSARIYWMADNQQKGISSVPAVTIHATPEYSRAHFEDSPDKIVAEILEAASSWLGGDPLVTNLRRWRYSIPLQLYPARTLLLHLPGPLAFAGDAFAGPRVEGASLSGMAAGGALRTALRDRSR